MTKGTVLNQTWDRQKHFEKHFLFQVEIALPLPYIKKPRFIFLIEIMCYCCWFYHKAFIFFVSLAVCVYILPVLAWLQNRKGIKHAVNCTDSNVRLFELLGQTLKTRETLQNFLAMQQVTKLNKEPKWKSDSSDASLFHWSVMHLF